MNKEKAKDEESELVRIVNPALIKKIKRNKKKTGVGIGKFFEVAALEKLKRDAEASGE